MNKPFLLIAGYNYYPEAGTDDWKDCYSTMEEARSKITIIKNHQYYQKGKNKGEIKETTESYQMTIDDEIREYDWYEIVDLRNWTEKS